MFLLDNGRVSLVRISWSFVYCCRYCWLSLTEVRRAHIVTLHVAKLHCSMTAVHNAIIKFNDDGIVMEDYAQGRPL